MKRLNSKVLHDDKWIFRIDRVELDNGLQIDLPMIDHPGSIVLVPILDGKILMIRQFRPVAEKTVLELPAGTLEWGENAIDGAQRELREETGYQADNFILLSEIKPSVSSSTEVMRVLLATGLTWAPLPRDEDETIELAPMEIAELAYMALNGSLNDAKSVIGVLQAQHYLSESKTGIGSSSS